MRKILFLLFLASLAFGLIKTNVSLNDSMSFYVTDVVDGDTIWVKSNGVERKFRYIGIDTPEITFGKNEYMGLEALLENEKLVLGRVVDVELDVQQEDDYGRVLAYIFVDGIMINEELVRKGYATVATYPPNVKYVYKFLEAERYARENNLGLWS